MAKTTLIIFFIALFAGVESEEPINHSILDLMNDPHHG